jgi:predicted transcriptional regulator
MADITPPELAAAANISPSYAWQIVHGTRDPSRKMAIHIWKTTGRKFPPISHLSDDDVEYLARIEAKAA